MSVYHSFFSGLIDQDYLVEALKNNRIGGAALDVTTPERLPAGHPLFQLNNACKFKFQDIELSRRKLLPEWKKYATINRIIVKLIEDKQFYFCFFFSHHASYWRANYNI